MKIAYFRKSSLEFDAVITRVAEAAKNAKWEIKSESTVKNGKLFHIFSSEIFEGLLGFHKEFVGFIPSILYVTKEEDGVFVGILDTGIIKDITSQHSHGEEKFVTQLDKQLKQMVQEVADVGELKVRGVKLFSTKSCPYCVMEKEWLETSKIEHTVHYVDEDQQMAQYMVQRTGQMGVPVTEVMYEGGDAEYIIGFDKTKLASLLQK